MKRNTNAFDRARALSFVLCLTAHLSEAYAEQKAVVIDEEVETVAGPLKLIRESTPVPGSRYWDVKYMIVFGNKTVIGPNESLISIQAAYPSQFDARVVLIFEGTGGNSCAGAYRVIEADPTGLRNVTESFGGCDEGTSEYRDGTLYVTIGDEIWKYSKSKLVKVKTPNKSLNPDAQRQRAG